MDTEQLVDTITRIIMERLDGAAPAPAGAATVVTFGDVPAGVLGAGQNVRHGTGAADTDGAEYIVLTQAAFRAFHGGATPAGLTSTVAAVAAPVAGPGGGTFEVKGKKVISERDVRDLNLTRGAVVQVDPGAIITALARDFVNSRGAKFA
ncbi:MAG: hypothetical protein LBI33_13730 [Propionibacteriaceae bacterium]|jgi:hypothetical protein|nr:hypothetical protein [Propionibacteriaceae bacterium]